MMTTKTTAWLTAIACASAAFTPATAQRQPSGDRPDVFILAGQSNMSGRGVIADLTDAERTPDPAIRLYGNDGQWRDALDPLDDATGQTDAVSGDPQAAVGPGLFFARALRMQTHRSIALVPCAKGGSSIAQWKPGGERDTLYGSCLAHARAAGGHLAGILWYQGETDAEQPRDTAYRWSAEFVALIRAFRGDLAARRLPIVLVQIADAPGPPNKSNKYPS